MLEHLQQCKVDNLQLIPAKFDENVNSRERYIVSGFGDYVVVWNLSQVIKGDVWNYKFSKTDGKLLQVDFRYNDIRKLIMVSEEGIKIKENKVRIKWFPNRKSIYQLHDSLYVSLSLSKTKKKLYCYEFTCPLIIILLKFSYFLFITTKAKVDIGDEKQ